MTANKIFFGITGQTGSGKSYVSDLFRKNGVTVYDGDKIGHDVMEAGKPCLLELCRHFGEEILAKDGSLIRKNLAKLVFSDPEKLCILNKISHNYIKKEIISQLENCTTKAAAIDGAVIIGSEIEPMCSFLVGVVAPAEMRLKRIISRDGISQEAALERMNAQPDDEFYRKRCKYIIENDLTTNSEDMVRHILEKELS